jgi:hypothetical protein
MAAISNHPPHDAHSLSDLMTAGDEACRRECSDELAHAARLLAACVAVPFQLELQDIAAAAYGDLGAASARWAVVCDHLRGRLARAAPSAAS